MAGTRAALISGARWIAVLVPVAEVGLVLSGVLDVRTAVVVGVVLEALLAVVVVGEVAAFHRAYRRARAVGDSRAGAAGAGLRAAWPPVLISLASAEIGLWRALWWALRGRRDVGAGE